MYFFGGYILNNFFPVSFSIVYFFFLVPFSTFFSSPTNFRCSFFTSSAADKFSGTMPLLFSILLTARLLSMCSFSILLCPFRSLLCAFNPVISAAKSLALILMVGKKSATPFQILIAVVQLTQLFGFARQSSFGQRQFPASNCHHFGQSGSRHSGLKECHLSLFH